MWKKLICVIVYLLGCAHSALVVLKATIDNGGVKGNVTFTQDGAGSPVAVTYDLNGPTSSSVASFELRNYRVMYDVSDRCSLARLGEKKYPLDTATWSSTGVNVNDLDLTGLQSVEGLSLALFQTGQSEPMACGNVEREGNYDTASATFRKGIVGHVTFRQAPSALTRVTYDLKLSDPSTANILLEWRVVGTGDCYSVAPPYSPVSGASSDCNSTTQSSCAIGDLSEKLGRLTFDPATNSTRGSAVDLNLPLIGDLSVVNKALQIVADSNGAQRLVACTTITKFKFRSGTALFSNRGAVGSVDFTQRSPFDRTAVKVELTGLQQRASGWHVHAWPVPQRVDSNQSLCGADSTAGHFNPFAINVSASPPAGTSTPDLYEIGDLSGKFGKLDGLNSLSATYLDSNLPLFGVQSVLGRSLVIHNPNSSRWICTNVRDTAAVTYALATFAYPVIGYVLMRQQVADPYGDTAVFVQLNYADGTTSATSNHTLVVHANPVTADFLADDNSRCASTGRLYAPYAVGAGSGCTPATPLLCEVGDLLGKHGPVPVRDAKVFFTDVSLPLQGDQSVVGRSLVLHAANGGPSVLSCATILQVQPLNVEVSTWDLTKTTSGKVTLTQQVGVVQEPTALHWELLTMPVAFSISPKVQEKPFTDGATWSGLGGVYDPFGVGDGIPGTTKDTFPVGDLSGKFGNLTGPAVTKYDSDTNLDLWGPRSVLGRALTLTSGDSLEAAATLTAKSSVGGQLVQAKAVFTGDVTGEILLSQYVYENGAHMPTTMVLNLRRASGNETLQHNWHTHERSVLGDGAASPGRCDSTGGHFNPFKVNMQATYSQECKRSNPMRCELGDQSSKLGTYDMGSGAVVVNDPYLPLTGMFGVVGRSIVVHAETRGAARLACADILPVSMTTAVSITVSKPASLSRDVARVNLSRVLDTAFYNLALEWVSHDDKRGCSVLRVYFLGPEADQLKAKLHAVISNTPTSLGDLKPVSCSDPKTGASSACSPGVPVLLTLMLGLLEKILL